MKMVPRETGQSGDLDASDIEVDLQEILTAIAVGAAIGAGASMAVQAVQRGDDWWRINRTDGSSVVKSAIVGGIAGAVSGGVGYGVSELFSGPGMSFFASVGQGAAVGGAAGATGGFAGYTAGVWTGNDFEGLNGWKLQYAGAATIGGGASGALLGGISGGWDYVSRVNEAAKRSAELTVADYNALNNPPDPCIDPSEYGTQHDAIKGTGGGYSTQAGQNGRPTSIEFPYAGEYTKVVSHAEPIPFNYDKTDLVNWVDSRHLEKSYGTSNIHNLQKNISEAGGRSAHFLISNPGINGAEHRVFLPNATNSAVSQVGNVMTTQSELQQFYHGVFWSW